ncbi:class III lanthipeptide [Streptococcus suis]|uniref:class III lanthipeptide n=1 Tax=Streptococcus suis TaxID=1307 RepID=UPI00137B5ABE|nr:class III lanthipeptide [Streptococcus suis]
METKTNSMDKVLGLQTLPSTQVEAAAVATTVTITIITSAWSTVSNHCKKW